MATAWKMGRLAAPSCALVVAMTACGGSSGTRAVPAPTSVGPRAAAAAPAGSAFTLLQWNVCLSGLAGCYRKVAYPAVLAEAVARIHDARPDAVTFSEACRNDVALIARRTGYHLRFSRVIYRGRPLACIRPGGRGLFGDAVLTRSAVESTDNRDFHAQAGIERRRWLCVTTRLGIDVCTAHLNTRSATERAGNDAQCAELAALLARRAGARTVIFGGDVNRDRSCAPRASGPAPTARPTRTPASSRSTEAARCARPRRRWWRPCTATTTSWSSARAFGHGRPVREPAGPTR